MEIPLYQVRDLRFSAEATGNPYDVALSAHFAGPAGTRLTLPGFYDGDDTWIIRFAPPQVGEWSFETESDLESLHGRRQDSIHALEPASAAVHGVLRVDPQHPHHFIYADKTRCFPLGDECDWLFALDHTEARRYLDRLRAYGFNQVLMQVYAHSCNWSEGQPHRLVPPPRYPWKGDNENPDHSRMNPAFWQHLDRIIGYMQNVGILAHLMIEVHNKNVNWPDPGSRDEDRYWRYVVSRYQAYSNVIWNLSKEQWKRDDPQYWDGRATFVRQLDGYGHLVTTHDRELAEGDFLADQQHRNFHDHILHQRDKRAWPVMNVEYGYEPGPIPTYGRFTLPDEMRCRTWEIITAGGYPVYYYSDTAWDVIYLDPLPEGYLAFRVIRAAMDRVPYWEMAPSDQLVDKGYCLAKPGDAYLVYLPEGGRVHVDMSAVARLERGIRAAWVNPRTGQEIDLGPVRGGVNSFTTPVCFGAGDSLLVVA